MILVFLLFNRFLTCAFPLHSLIIDYHYIDYNDLTCLLLWFFQATQQGNSKNFTKHCRSIGSSSVKMNSLCYHMLRKIVVLMRLHVTSLFQMRSVSRVVSVLLNECAYNMHFGVPNGIRLIQQFS